MLCKICLTDSSRTGISTDERMFPHSPLIVNRITWIYWNIININKHISSCCISLKISSNVIEITSKQMRERKRRLQIIDYFSVRSLINNLNIDTIKALTLRADAMIDARSIKVKRSGSKRVGTFLFQSTQYVSLFVCATIRNTINRFRIIPEKMQSIIRCK